MGMRIYIFLLAGVFINTLSAQVIMVNRPSSQSYSISGKVFIDNNGDGLSTSESGYTGLQINLYKSDGSYVNYTYSNASGNFSFTNCAAGGYYIEAITLSNYRFTFSNVGSDEALDSDIDELNGPKTSATFSVTSNVSNLGVGIYQCTPGILGSINGILWYDSTPDHVMQSYENGVNGISVKLWRNNFGSWIPWATKSNGIKPGTASTDGFYYFECVLPGQYFIESPFTSLPFSNPNVGSDDAIDSEIDHSNGIGTTPVFTLTSGGYVTNLHGGYGPNPSISSLSCGSAVFAPAVIMQGSSYTGTMTVPYTGGNGAYYPAGGAIPSTGVTGLTATLRAGTLTSGAGGNLVYDVTGTPSGSGTAYFALNFGGQSCTVSKTVEAVCTTNIKINNSGSWDWDWDGFQLQLVLNGVTLGTYTFAGSWSPITIPVNIPVSAGGTLDVNVVNLGSNQSQVYFNIIAPNGSTWYSGYPNHSLGLKYSASIFCP